MASLSPTERALSWERYGCPNHSQSVLDARRPWTEDDMAEIDADPEYQGVIDPMDRLKRERED